ncbi:MAG: hypothetical protein A3G34_03190 [Candidatus Lindowbacteria bacterium RIFCSPLOWO2_12_FULL_62_27]|nr:MAG: hypothetical protein A3G34_03190 [Candidatus Lindowbacteria bacterium RIFCSPLOWO2_12_FULL_62_27]
MIERYYQKEPYLPLQPTLRKKLQAIMDSKEAQEVRRAAMEEAIHAFPLLAFNLLKLVNSSVFNLKTKVTVLKQAASLPTFDLFKDMIQRTPEYPPDLEPVMTLNRFEEHSRATALTVQLLATLGRRFSTTDRERLFTAALLHDIGRIFLVMSDPDGYRNIQKDAGGSGSVVESERKYFGTDHATLSALAVEQIGIADPLVLDAIRRHHEIPTGASILVAYADRLVKRFGIGPSEGGAMSESAAHDEARLKVALEETVQMTVGEIMMHVLSEVDTLMSSGLAQFKSLTASMSI